MSVWIAPDKVRFNCKRDENPARKLTCSLIDRSKWKSPPSGNTSRIQILMMGLMIDFTVNFRATMEPCEADADGA